MQGLELAKAYYEEYGAPMLHEQFPELEGLIAAGLCGSGSECLGYDDEVSQDHDFEAGFCLFLPGEDVIDRQTAFRLERAYAKLPKEFRGFKKSLLSPAGGNRHGVVRMSEFFLTKLGTPSGELTAYDWFRVPEYSILETVNGEIWRDDSGIFTAKRDALKRMPEVSSGTVFPADFAAVFSCSFAPFSSKALTLSSASPSSAFLRSSFSCDAGSITAPSISAFSSFR